MKIEIYGRDDDGKLQFQAVIENVGDAVMLPDGTPSMRAVAAAITERLAE